MHTCTPGDQEKECNKLTRCEECVKPQGNDTVNFDCYWCTKPSNSSPLAFKCRHFSFNTAIPVDGVECTNLLYFVGNCRGKLRHYYVHCTCTYTCTCTMYMYTPQCDSSYIVHVHVHVHVYVLCASACTCTCIYLYYINIFSLFNSPPSLFVYVCVCSRVQSMCWRSSS